MNAKTSIQSGVKLIGEFGPLGGPPRVVTVERVTPTGQIKIANEPARYKSLDADWGKGMLIGVAEHDGVPGWVRHPNATDDLEAIQQARNAYLVTEGQKRRKHNRVLSLAQRAQVFSDKHRARWGSHEAKDWPYTDEQLNALDAALKAFEEQA